MIGEGLWTARGIDLIAGYSASQEILLSSVPVQRYQLTFSRSAAYGSVAPKEARKQLKEAEWGMARAKLAV
jgi:hypothetical protein